MEANAGLVAGSHKRNEFVRIRHEGEVGPKPLKHLNSQVCQICGDTVGLTATGDVFIACNECAFPVCRSCYEYERKDGYQSCPQCKTQYKRHQGSPRVDGDDDEDGVDDLENEFEYAHGNRKATQQRQVQGRGEDDLSASSRHDPIPLLTNGQPAVLLQAHCLSHPCKIIASPLSSMFISLFHGLVGGERIVEMGIPFRPKQLISFYESALE